ncbi:MAG: hypothetical protein HY074_16380 [Deltaproteobacteria bacterium]|nr:hypothetical protein [Deltaproteobacteria bacterium]
MRAIFICSVFLATVFTGVSSARAAEEPLPNVVAPISCSHEEAPNGNPAKCICPPGYKYSWHNPGNCHREGPPKQILREKSPPKYLEPYNCSNEETPSGHPVHCECKPGYVYVASDGERCVNFSPDALDVDGHKVDDDGRKHHHGLGSSDDIESVEKRKAEPEKQPVR